jgi:hypothetical protein
MIADAYGVVNIVHFVMEKAEISHIMLSFPSFHFLIHYDT